MMNSGLHFGFLGCNLLVPEPRILLKQSLRPAQNLPGGSGTAAWHADSWRFERLIEHRGRNSDRAYQEQGEPILQACLTQQYASIGSCFGALALRLALLFAIRAFFWTVCMCES